MQRGAFYYHVDLVILISVIWFGGLERKIITDLLLSFSYFFFAETFPEYREFATKKYFAGQQTANTLQLFVAVKWNFSGLFFFWTSLKERKFPRNYLINAATSLFVSRKENFPETAW